MPTPDFSKIWASTSPLTPFTFTDAQYNEGWDFVGSAPPTKNQFDAFFKLVDEKLNYLYSQLQDTASKLYPVGSVYISFDPTDPSTMFGGTWVRLKDTFLLVNGDTYSPGSTGGSATKTISTNNLPSHTHSCNTTGNHTHTRGTMNITGHHGLDDRGFSDLGGAFSKGATSGALGASGSDTGAVLEFDASKSWTGATSSSGAHTHVIGNTGGGLPLNIMPPYTTVYAWRRTA